MTNFVETLNKELDAQLQLILQEETCTIKKASRAIGLLKNALHKLKQFTIAYAFHDEAEEIFFFKYTKPELFGKLIYAIRILDFETLRPHGSREAQETYIRTELAKIYGFRKHHFEFYQYYRTESTHFDDRYFLRGRDEISVFDDNLPAYIDPDFSTARDFFMAKILATERFYAYLNRELDRLSGKLLQPVSTKDSRITLPAIRWTDSKTALVELIYALHAAGVFNNGACELGEIAAFFGMVATFQTKDIYRSFIDIKQRKEKPTRFIDFLKTALTKKIEEDI